MNVLSITGILPIPEIYKSNDFLIPLYSKYNKHHPSDKILFFRTFKYKPLSKFYRRIHRLKEYNLDGFPVMLIPFLSIWRYKSLHSLIASYSAYYMNRRKIMNFIKVHGINIIQAEYIIPDGYLAFLISRKCNIPYTVTTHNESRYFNSLISRNSVLKVLKNASYITPLNYPSMELYKKHNVGNIVMIPHGIDERFLQTIPQNNNHEEIRILSVGVLVPLKNFDKVIQAISKLRNNFKIKYTIIGSGPERERLAALIHSLELEEIVNFVERIPYDEIPHEMSINDIFIMPSYVETFGRVLFEAMAVGLPIICAKNTGIHGYFKEGEEGLSVNHRDINDIESKLSMLLTDATLRQEMGRKAKELMVHYTWDNIANTFQDLFKKSLHSFPDHSQH